MSKIVTTPDGTRHVFPDEASDDQITQALASAPAPAPASLPPVPGSDLTQGHPIRTGIRRVAAALPSALGIAGGMSGIPFGAALGGAGGEGLHQTIDAMTGGIDAASSGEAAKKMAIAGSEQQLAHGIGRLAGAGLGVMGKLGESGAKLNGILQAAEQRGVRFSKDALIPHINAVAKHFGENSLTPAADVAVIKRLSDQLPNDLSPTRLQAIKLMAQRRLGTLYEKMNGGKFIPKGVNPRADYYRAIAEGAQKNLESIPGVAERNAITQRWIGGKNIAQKVLGRAALGAGGAVAGAALPGSPAHRMATSAGGAAIGAGLGGPAATALLRGASSRAGQVLLRNLPHLAPALLDQLNVQEDQ